MTLRLSEADAAALLGNAETSKGAQALPVTRSATKHTAPDSRDGKKRKTAPVKSGSTLERRFDTLWRQFAPASMPAPIAEFQALPPRRWRIDRSWPLLKVAVELEGGVWSGGRHTRGSGFTLDCEKYNALTAESWLILRFTSDMLRDDPEGCIALVVDVLETRQRQQAMPRGAAAATGGDDEAGEQCGA